MCLITWGYGLLQIDGCCVSFIRGKDSGVKGRLFVTFCTMVVIFDAATGVLGCVYYLQDVRKSGAGQG